MEETKVINGCKNGYVGRSSCTECAVYGSEAWVRSASLIQKLNVFEMDSLRKMCGVRRMDRIRNDEIRRRCECKQRLSERADRAMLRWYGHLERMEEERMVKQLYEASVNGVRPRGRPRKRWKDGVKDIAKEIGRSIQEFEGLAKDRTEWKKLCKGLGG